jgi:hypothetical protein
MRHVFEKWKMQQVYMKVQHIERCRPMSQLIQQTQVTRQLGLQRTTVQSQRLIPGCDQVCTSARSLGGKKGDVISQSD